MYENTKARMLLTTAALAAVAAFFAGGANARLMDVDGGTAAGAARVLSSQPQAIPYLSHGIGVDASQFSGRTTSLGLTGDSPLTRVSAPESVGLTGDSAATRYPRQVGTTVTPGGSDVDWTSFGAGAGLAALLAAAVAGIVLTTRRRGGVALP